MAADLGPERALEWGLEEAEAGAGVEADAGINADAADTGSDATASDTVGTVPRVWSAVSRRPVDASVTTDDDDDGDDDGGGGGCGRTAGGGCG